LTLAYKLFFLAATKKGKCPLSTRSGGIGETGHAGTLLSLHVTER
jgi:hypothetical protein